MVRRASGECSRRVISASCAPVEEVFSCPDEADLLEQLLAENRCDFRAGPALHHLHVDVSKVSMKERTQPTVAPEEIRAALSQITDLGRDRAGRPQLDPSCRRPEPKPTAADYSLLGEALYAGTDRRDGRGTQLLAQLIRTGALPRHGSQPLPPIPSQHSLGIGAVGYGVRVGIARFRERTAPPSLRRRRGSSAGSPSR